MLKNLKLIFVHGIAAKTTGYSAGLYDLVLAACRRQLHAAGHSEDAIEHLLTSVVEHETLWANFTTDLTNRYLQLAYPATPWFWGKLIRPLDPLMIQILEYVKDKGDKGTGLENILAGFDQEMQRIFSYQDIGQDPGPKEGRHAIFVAHSLGSVIAFDYLMGFRDDHQLDRTITVPSLITLGSPIPIFISAMGHPDSDLVLPPNIKSWLNIRSPRDGIARPMKPFFRNIRIDEQLVHTRFTPMAAHSAYWTNHATAELIARQVVAALHA